MTDTRQDDRRTGADREGGSTGSERYEGPGGWGTAAIALMAGLFLISVALTVHSLVATFGGA